MAERVISFVFRGVDQLSTVTRKAVEGLGQIGQQAANTARTLAGLGNTFIALTGGVSGFAAASKAIREARGDLEAMASLQAAAQGNPVLIKQVQKLSEELGKFAGGAASVQKIAADLLNRGVPENKLETSIRAAVDTSAALRISLESAADGIAQTFGGTVPRDFAKAVPALKDIEEGALRGGKAVDELAKVYRGRAAEIAGSNVLGKIAVSQNRINDAFSGLGQILLEIQARTLPAFAALVERIVEALNTPFAKQLVSDLGDLAAALSDNIGYIVGFIAAIKGVAIGITIFEGLVAAVTAIGGGIAIALTPIGALVIALTAVGAVILELTGARKVVTDWLGDVWKRVTDLAESVRKGEISFKDLFNVIVTEARVVVTRVKGYFFDPIKALVAGVISELALQPSAAFATVKVLSLSAAKFIADGWLTLTRTIAEAFDKMTNTAADALNKIPGVSKGVGDAIRTSLAAAVPESVPELDKLLKTATDEAKYAAEAIKKNRAETVDIIAAGLANTSAEVANLREANDLEAKRNAEIRERNRYVEAFNKKEAEDREFSRQLDKRKQAFAAASRDMAAANKVFNAEQLQTAITSLETEFKLRKVTEEQYLTQRAELENRAGAARLAALVKERDQALVGIGGLEALNKLQGESVERVAQQAAAARRVAELNEQIKKSEAEINALVGQQAVRRQESAEAVKKTLDEIQVRTLRASMDPAKLRQADELELAAKHAQEMVEARQKLNAQQLEALAAAQRAEKLAVADQGRLAESERLTKLLADSRDKYNAAVARTTDLFQAGAINIFEAQRRNVEAQEEYTGKIDETRAALMRLQDQAANPETSRKIGEQVKETNDQAREAKNNLVTYGATIDEVARGPLEQFGQTVILNFKDAKQAATQFFSGIAQNLAQLASQLLAQAALRSLFSALGGAGGPLASLFSSSITTGKAAGGAVGVMLSPGEHVYGPAGAGVLGGQLLAGINSMSLSAGMLRALVGAVVPGPDVRRDIVPAAVPRGSYVVRRAAAEHYGYNLLAALPLALAGVFPRFAGGGEVKAGGNLSGALRAALVPSVPGSELSNMGLGVSHDTPEAPARRGSSAAMGYLPVLPADAQTADRILAGGDAALIEWAGRNRETLRALLGGGTNG